MHWRVESADWEGDKFNVELLAGFFKFYGDYFSELCDLSPDHVVTLNQAERHAKTTRSMELLRRRLEAKLRKIECNKSNFDRAAIK